MVEAIGVAIISAATASAATGAVVGAYAVAGVSLATIVGTTALVGGSLLVQTLTTPDTKQKVASRQFASKQALPARRRAYGRVKLSGYYIAFDANGGSFLIGIYLVEGPIDAYEEVWLDDRKSALPPGSLGGAAGVAPWLGAVTLELHLGETDQAASPILRQLPYWTENHRLRGCAYLVQAAQSSGSLFYDTLAQLNANLAPDDKAQAQVTADDPNNGLYAKSGASGSGSWVLKTKATVPALDARAASLEAVLDPAFSTLDPDALYIWSVLNALGKRFEFGRVAADGTWTLPALKTGSITAGDGAIAWYDTLEPASVAIVDQNRRILKEFTPTTGVDALVAEVAAARGTQPSLDARLSVSLEAGGRLKDAPIWGAHLLGMSEGRLSQIISGDPGSQFVHALLGDSWAYLPSFSSPYARRMQARYGNAGPGWLGFTDNQSGLTVTGPGAAISVNTVTVTGSGWVETNITAPTPDLGKLTSSTAGDRITVKGPATPVLSAVRLFFVPTANGQMQYRWNGGAWTALSVSDASGIVALAGLPTSGAWTLDIDVVSGTCSPAGLNVASADNGVRITKIATSGSALFQWLTQMQTAAWRSAFAALAPHHVTILHGTNDQAGSRTPAQFAADMGAVIDILRAVVPGIDITVMMPPENLLGRTVAMASLAAAAREVVIGRRACWIDLQPFFGVQAADYGPSSARPLLNTDNVHESGLGGRMMADILARLVGTGA